jgi:hypothetical protein
MAAYHGRESVTELAFYLRVVLGWSFDQAHRLVQLCQQN